MRRELDQPSPTHEPDRTDHARTERDERHPEDPRAASAVDQGRDVFSRGLDLPRGHERERFEVDRHIYELRAAEVQTLATIGAFRVLHTHDLRDAFNHGRRDSGVDLDTLQRAGLVREVRPNLRSPHTTVVTLTERGRALLEAHRRPGHEPRQAFYAGVARPRELTHDAQCYRAYRHASDHLVQSGAHLLRVRLEHELKRDYQRFLQDGNRGRHDSDGRPTRTPEEVCAWATANALPVIDGHVHFPDVRIEYERADGQWGVRDLEVETLHYRGAHAAGKVAAGFSRYRATTSRVGGGTSSGSAPFDPDVAREFL